ncbi:MAG: chromate resistance protein ChrB domain-containing protein [Thermodesulfobacteriota bacterium]
MWIIFSYTVPAKNPNVRLKAWRRLQAVGAVQLKSSLYVLPLSEANYEHLQWLAREVEELGGEAVFFQCPAVENLSEDEIKAIFGRARDEDYARLHEEIRAFAKSLEAEALEPEDKARELQVGLKKFTRKFQAIQEIDFFPTGQGERTAMLMASLQERFQVLTGAEVKPATAPLLNKEYYQGKTWVTRERPYIDRLASFWLVRRFIDSDAKLAFIPPQEKMQRDPGLVYFDMAGAEFTHRDGLITFEVLLSAIGLQDQGTTRLAALVRAIDLKEDLEGLEEAKTLKDLVDGLVKITPNDGELVQRALLIFDALYAAYQGGTS